MSNNKHNIGPWAYIDREKDGLMANIWNPQNIDIARVLCTDMESGMANARLVAAAPELLDALAAEIAGEAFADLFQLSFLGFSGQVRIGNQGPTHGDQVRFP